MIWKRLLKGFFSLVSLTCFGALIGCATNTIPSGSRFVVSTLRAGFYKYGPAQAFGPDFTLSEGTEVTIIQYSEGFSHVRTSDGLGGYMYNEDLKPAPPKPPSAEETAAARRNLRPLYPQKPDRGNLQPNFATPLFHAVDAPLPERSGNPKPVADPIDDL